MEPLPTPVKKVSFSLPHEPARAAPYIRPDSPTLGFDDEYFAAGLTRSKLPDVPRRPQSPGREEDDEDDEDEDEDDATPRAVTRPPNPFEDDRLGDPFMLPVSVNRYCEHLAELKSQLASHSANLGRPCSGTTRPGGASPRRRRTRRPSAPAATRCAA